MRQYNSLSALFKDVGLSIAKKHKANNLTAIHPLEFAEKIDSIDVINNADNIPLGEVKDIRFSIVGGVLNICWNDPFDVIQNGSTIVYFGMTKLVAKLGDYPQNPDDGTTIYSSTTRDKHSYTPYTCDLNALGLIQDEQEIFFKFFSATSGNYWNTDFLQYGANQFSSSSYDWQMIYSALKDYSNSRPLLPPAGSTVYIDYIARDYYIENGKNIAAETRADVVANIDKLSAVATPWRILGYNANVPQYVGYRRYDESIGQWQYIYVQSVDDSLSAVNCHNADGTVSQMDLFVGSKQFIQITAGCRTYTEDAWDYLTCKKSYTDTGHLVESASTATFGYDNEGTGAQNIYYVPTQITVDSKEYDFCGYTMTIQPQNCLISFQRTSDTAASEYNTIQFDLAEIQYVNPLNSFPDAYDSSKRYFSISDDGIHEIDWSTSALVDINSVSEDVYLLEDNELKLQTAYFEKYHDYWLYSNIDGVETYEQIPEILEFEIGVPYYNACPPKSYNDTNDPKQLSVYADVVRYNGQLYVCKTNITAEKNNNTPDQLTAYFRALTSNAELTVKSLYDQGKYFVPGQRITPMITDKTVVEKNMPNTKYGRNTYEESFYKQYCNNINGSRRSGEIEYKTKHKMDVVSTTGLVNSNGLLLKLHKETQLIQHICPAANRTVISTITGPYRNEYQKNNRQVWETSLDIFWPLALYEVFGSGVDGSSTFSSVYSDNASRIKMRMLADGSASTTAVYWWLRYPNTGHSYSEYTVNTSGAQYNTYAHYAFGFSPACIIA